MQNFRSNIDQSDVLSPSEREQVAREIEVAQEKEPPPTLVLIGETGVGKSTTINSLFNAGQKVSATKAATPSAQGLEINTEFVKGSKGLLRVFDMPGLGDDMQNYASYIRLYREVLPLADVVLWIHPAEDRMVQLVQQALSELFVHSLPWLTERLVFGLNKADEMSPHDWNAVANIPSQSQHAHLLERESDFKQKISHSLPQWRGKVIAYSALRRYQLTPLFKEMIYAMPESRRWVLEERMDLADFFQLVDKGILKAAQKRSEERRPTTAEPTSTQATGSSAETLPDASRVASLIAAMSSKEYAEMVADRNRLVSFLARALGHGYDNR